ncbi:unnamed protein product [Acanthoscelides obtectus]|uniref:Uncharacterized protein n=1 Tax=Acanthoscelides obtectus TaxID=200917 RepID=A0A9P0MHW5_ACAOB|nr:unnamed protein product [Acanthoscelides obtectus]CAK1642504.1 hypothetical protein AOBTE_LOCUS13074 [Acanthoscelides obtectus]
MIRSHVSENPDEHPFNILPYAVQCYNSTRNKTTGFTPYELVFGHTSGRPPEHVYLEKELMSKSIQQVGCPSSEYTDALANVWIAMFVTSKKPSICRDWNIAARAKHANALLGTIHTQP